MSPRLFPAARGLAAVLVLAAGCASAPPATVARPAAAPGPVAAPTPAPAPTAPAPIPWQPTPPPPPLAAAPLPPPRTAEVTLPNGLRVVAVEHHRRPVVSVRLVLARGALSDPEGVAGATYLAVQLATDYHEQSERGEPLVEEKSLRRQAIDLGGAAWAHVGHDGSILAVDGYAEDTGRYLALLSDAVMAPRCGEESYRGRRNAMLDAIEDVEAADPEALERVLNEAAFGPGHPYARSVVGTKASLEPLGLEDVAIQQKQVLAPQGATLLVVGDVKVELALALARKAFSAWDAEAYDTSPPEPTAVSFGIRDVLFLRRKPASTLLVCASRPLADLRASDAALEVFAAVLGGGLEGRLPAVLRERNTLTYSAWATVLVRRHARAFLACAPLASARADLGVRLFKETLEGLRAAPPTAAELARARALHLARLESAHDDVAHSTGTWLEATLLGQRRPRLEEERQALARVSAAEVQAIARAALRPDTIRWIVSGDPGAAALAIETTRLGRLRPYLARP